MPKSTAGALLRFRSDRSIPDGACAPVAWGDVQSGGYRRRIRSLPSPTITLSAVLDGTEGSHLLLADETSIWTLEGRRERHPADCLGAGVELTGACLVHDRRGTDRLWFTARRNGEALGLLVSERSTRTLGWTRPRLLVASDRSTDAYVIASPCVIQDRGGWRIWYAGCDGETWRIHAAHSRDGISAQPLGVALDVGEDGDGDAVGVLDPSVVRVRGGLLMVYRADPSRAIHIASCPEGQGWRKQGPALFRGSPGRPDDEGPSNPVLLPSIAGRRMDLAYIAIDREGRRSVMRVDDFVDGATPPERVPAGPAPAARLRQVIRWIPPSALTLQLDPEKDAPPFVDPENGIAQVPGASTPVFVIELPRGKKVVKFGRSPAFIEREFDRGRVAARFIPTPPTDLHYIEGRPLLVSDYIAGPALVDLARTDPAAFATGLKRVLEDSLAMWSSTCVPYDPELVEFTPHPPQRLICTLGALAARRDVPALTSPITVNGERIGLSLAEIATASIPIVARRPTWLVFANGDAQLNHYPMSSDNTPLAIDLEYAGWFDIDFAAYALYVSLLYDGHIFRNVTLNHDHGGLDIAYDVVNTTVRDLLTAGAFLHTWAELPVRLERVFAYTFAMVVRWCHLYANPRSDSRWTDGMAQIGEAVTLFHRLGVLGGARRKLRSGLRR